MRIPVSLLILCALTVTLSAQNRDRSAEPGPWRPWTMAAIASVKQQSAVTPADLQAFTTRLQEFAEIIKRSPAAAQPIGFAGELWGALLGTALPPATGQAAGRVPLFGSVSFAAFPLVEYVRNGKVTNEDLKGGETETLDFSINFLESVAVGSRPFEWGGELQGAGFEPKPGASVGPMTRLNDRFVLKRHDKPLWAPISVADALAPIVKIRRENFESRRDAYAKDQAEFAQWQTPAKRAARRADWQQAAASMPKGAEFIAQMEKTDQQLEAMKKAELAPGGNADKGVRQAEAEFKAADGAVQGLSSEGRAEPACYDDRATAIDARFRAKRGAPASCQALVTANRAYFDTTLPRTAPQLLVLNLYERCLTPQSIANKKPGGCVTNRKVIESMDWNAVQAWLNR
ncbi:MAG TPA: hypothetical protein VJN96_26225 [Vicinamibacterales bacterium]|nr:hypothetical protein [Vicinamibacterales bacterium]